MYKILERTYKLWENISTILLLYHTENIFNEIPHTNNIEKIVTSICNLKTPFYDIGIAVKIIKYKPVGATFNSKFIKISSICLFCQQCCSNMVSFFFQNKKLRSHVKINDIVNSVNQTLIDAFCIRQHNSPGLSCHLEANNLVYCPRNLMH